MDDCDYYQNYGIGHNIILNNVTFKGINKGGLNRIMLVMKP